MTKRKRTDNIGKIPPQVSLTFFSTLLFGMLAHSMALFNKFSWYDDISYLFDVGHTATSGRWMLHILAWLETVFYQDGGHFSMSLFNGFLSLLLLSASACLVAGLFHITRPVYCAAMGCVMASFPVITSLFCYMFTAHFYMLALLMTVLAAWLLCRTHRWWVMVLAVLPGACAMGIYQAFIPMVLAILILEDIRILMEEERSPVSFCRLLLIQLAWVAGMVILYFLMSRLLLARLGLSLSGYMGIDQAGRESFQTYLTRMGTAYRECFFPSEDALWNMYPYRLHTLYQLVLLGNILLGMRMLLEAGKQDIRKAIMMGFLFALFPLACNFIFVMAKDVHGLMVYPQVMQFVLFIWLLDRQTVRASFLRRTVSALSALILGMAGFLYVRLDNQCYLKAELQQQEAISWLTGLVGQIKSSPDYRADRPVFFWDDEIEDPTITTLPELETVRIMGYQNDTRKMMALYSEWRTPMERWCGFTPVYYEDRSILEKPEVQAMPHYPDAGSIQIVDGVLVVRF